MTIGGGRMVEIGEKISYFRKAKGLSIRELSKDICDESTIYRLEKGKQMPRLEILNDICLKLEISFNTLFPFNKEVEDLKKLCREFTYQEDFLSLEITLDACYEVLEEIKSVYARVEFHRFIQWHHAILLHKRDKQDTAAINLLDSLVKLNHCGSELDINILNSKGLIYLSINNNVEAHKIYEVIYKKIKRYQYTQDYTLLPRVGYNHASALYKLKKYEEALKIALELLYYSESNQLLYQLGELHHMIGLLYKKLNSSEEANEFLNKAILIFSFTHNMMGKEKATRHLNSLL